MRFHRVVVAHGTRKRCRRHLGGTGTLVLKPDIVGKAHYERDCEPFLIGDVDPTKGFVHVLDDISLDVVLGHLDTVADFIAYLTKKEAFYRSEKLALAGGEDDLLAYYLHDINDQEEHDFIYPAGTDAVVVEPGQWQLFSAEPSVCPPARGELGERSLGCPDRGVREAHPRGNVNRVHALQRRRAGACG